MAIPSQWKTLIWEDYSVKSTSQTSHNMYLRKQPFCSTLMNKKLTESEAVGALVRECKWFQSEETTPPLGFV